MKKLVTLLSMLAIVSLSSCSKNEEQTSLDASKEPITIGISTTTVSYSPLTVASRSGEGTDLLAVQVYEVDGSTETPIAYGLFEDWSAISFDGYSNTTYRVEATMIVDASEKIAKSGDTYALPFNTAVVSTIEYSSSAFQTLASSEATLAADDATYSTPNIDRYYGSQSKTVSASDATISTQMKRMSFGVAADGIEEDITLSIAGAPSVTLSSSSVEIFSMNDFAAAYSADESTESYSEVKAVEILRNGASIYSKDVTFMRNTLATISVDGITGELGFDFEEEGFSSSTSSIRVLTFEDADYTAGDNFQGEQSWSSLIDSDQGSGSLLYGAAYNWTDSGNTELHNEFVNGGYGYAFYSGGIAISNYYCAVESGVSYDKQLSIPVMYANGYSGNDGSKNFGVIYSDVYYSTSLTFSDGVARTIDHMYITNTSYALTTGTIGDSFGDPLTDEQNFWITATGYDADGNSVGDSTFYLATNGVFIEEWVKWDLSALGDVASLKFIINSDATNAYGSIIPSYAAIDDIAVIF